MYAVRFTDSVFADAPRYIRGIRLIFVFDGTPPADMQELHEFAKLNPAYLLGCDRLAIVAKWRSRKHFFKWARANGPVRGVWYVLGGELSL